jgi:hypothetical protein
MLLLLRERAPAREEVTAHLIRFFLHFLGLLQIRSDGAQ